MITEVAETKQMNVSTITWRSRSKLSTSLTIRGVLAIVMAFGLLGASGCISRPSVLIPAYAVSGKAVIRSPQGGQRLNFRWQQAQGEYRISVWGALGVGRVQLSGTEQALSVSGDIRGPVTGPAAQMMEQYLGWSVPLEAMNSWLRGQPANTLAQDLIATDDRGRVTSVKQAAWQIEFSQHELVDEQWRPKRLDITTAAVSVRVVLALPKPVMGP